MQHEGGLSARVAEKSMCFTAVGWHHQKTEKAFKLAINHLIYVGDDLYWYASSHQLKWFVFHYTLYRRPFSLRLSGGFCRPCNSEQNSFPKLSLLDRKHIFFLGCSRQKTLSSDTFLAARTADQRYHLCPTIAGTEKRWRNSMDFTLDKIIIATSGLTSLLNQHCHTY